MKVFSFWTMACTILGPSVAIGNAHLPVLVAIFLANGVPDGIDSHLLGSPFQLTQLIRTYPWESRDTTPKAKCDNYETCWVSTWAVFIRELLHLKQAREVCFSAFKSVWKEPFRQSALLRAGVELTGLVKDELFFNNKEPFKMIKNSFSF